MHLWWMTIFGLMLFFLAADVGARDCATYLQFSSNNSSQNQANHISAQELRLAKKVLGNDSFPEIVEIKIIPEFDEDHNELFRLELRHPSRWYSPLAAYLNHLAKNYQDKSGQGVPLTLAYGDPRQSHGAYATFRLVKGRPTITIGREVLGELLAAKNLTEIKHHHIASHEEFHGTKYILEEINGSYNLVSGAAWPRQPTGDERWRRIYDGLFVQLISGLPLAEAEFSFDETFASFITFHQFFKHLKAKGDLSADDKIEIQNHLLRMLFYLRITFRLNTYAYHYLKSERLLTGGFVYQEFRRPSFRVLIPHTFQVRDPAIDLAQVATDLSTCDRPMALMMDLEQKKVVFEITYQLPSKVLGTQLPATGDSFSVSSLTDEERTAVESFLRQQNYYFHQLYVAFSEAINQSFTQGELKGDIVALKHFADRLKDFDPNTFTAQEEVLKDWVPLGEQEIDEFTQKMELEYFTEGDLRF